MIKMTSGQKSAFSLLISISVFAVFFLLLNTKVFTHVENRFYAQSKIDENIAELDRISETCNLYISDILKKVQNGENAWINDSSVRSYYVQNPSESDVSKRRRLTEQLFAEIPSLDGIRIIDKNGKNVHFSTYDDTDLLRLTDITKIYKNYPDIVKDSEEIEFSVFENNTGESKSEVLFDDLHKRIIIYVPFCWLDGIYSGKCLFYLNIYEIQKSLADKSVISFVQNFTIYSDSRLKGGLVLGIPSGESKAFKVPVQNHWNTFSKPAGSASELKNLSSPEKILEMNDGRFWVILTSSRNDSIRVSGVFTSDVFELTKELKVLIYLCVFISIFLIIFLVFSFRRDPVAMLKKRIKQIQIAIIDEYLSSEESQKNGDKWSYVAGQLKKRKKDFTTDIVRSLNVHGKKCRKELDEYLEKNWDEIFSIFDNRIRNSSTESSPEQEEHSYLQSDDRSLSGTSIEEIRKVLEEVIKNAKLNLVVSAEECNDVTDDELEEIDDNANSDDIEELDDVEELIEDVEDIEELSEEIDEIDELDELEGSDVIEDEKDYTEGVIFSINQEQYKYEPSDDTYFNNNQFATVDNLYAEEIKLGSEYTAETKESKNYFKVFDLNDYSGEEFEKVEDLTEEVPVNKDNDYYSMSSFAEEPLENLQESESDKTN